MTLDEIANGVFPIAVTPFLPDGTLDLAGTDGLVEFYLERGATGLTILGVLGEALKLSGAEATSFTRHVLSRVGGRVPVVVGVTNLGFVPMGELARDAMEAGAAGVMVAPTVTLRTDDQLAGYFRQVVEMLGDTPLVLQDYPLLSGVQMSVALIRRLIAEYPTLVMLKAEDWPGLSKIGALRAGAERRVSILVGNGGLFLPEELARGADGAMTGYAFPEMLRDVVSAHASGNRERAQNLFDAHLPYLRYEQQQGIGLSVRKHVLAQRGAIPHATLRRPFAPLSPADIADIEFLLARQTRRLADIDG